MPTRREREYYAMGFRDGVRSEKALPHEEGYFEAMSREPLGEIEYTGRGVTVQPSPLMRAIAKPKRKLSAWNKYVKANSNKPRFRYKSGAKKGKLNLKKMAVAFRKTPAGKKKRR